MSGKSIISNAYLEDIGDAIRQKKGTEDTYYPSQMGNAIRSIENVSVDDSLSDTSENPVQNKVITQALQSKCDTETVSALADAVQDLDGDVQGLQTTVQSKANTTTVTALSNRVTAVETDKASHDEVDTVQDNVNLLGQIAQQYMEQTSVTLSGLQTGLASKVDDVQVNGTSVVTDGVANVPLSYGLQMLNGSLTTSKASFAMVRGSGNSYNPIVPDIQHFSTFYGLAKIAGHDEWASTLPVGTYSEEAKVAIQKMLGIYEAPWELINEETFTNETEADYIITTDANGDAFELTDLVLAFWLPKQSTLAKKGSYGHVRFMKNGADMVKTESGAWEQQANSSPRGFMISMEDHNGMVFVRQHVNALSGYTAGMTMRIPQNFDMTSAQPSIKFAGSDFYIDSINILAVTGTGHYRLYGKRKWN